jgi:membrane protease YdiL (CAAX protease family)
MAEVDSGPRLSVGVDDATSPVPGALVVIPWLIVLLAVVLAAWTVIRWNVRGRRDPLADVPPRPNTLAEDAILIAMGVYFLAVSLLSLIALETMSEGGTAASILVGNGGHLLGGLACLSIAHRRFVGGWSAMIFGATTQSAPTLRPHSNATKKSGDATPTPGSAPTIALAETCGHGHRRVIGVIAVTLIIAVGLCPLIAEATVWLYHSLRPDGDVAVHPTLVALGSSSEPWYSVMMLWMGAAFIAPMAEELFFRGLLQTWLAQRLHSRWRAIALSAIAFGLAHSGQPQAIPALFVLALLLGLAYERTGMLIVPIAVHAGFNLNTLVWQLLNTPRP